MNLGGGWFGLVQWLHNGFRDLGFLELSTLPSSAYDFYYLHNQRMAAQCPAWHKHYKLEEREGWRGGGNFGANKVCLFLKSFLLYPVQQLALIFYWPEICHIGFPTCKEAAKCNFPPEVIATLNKIGVLLLRKKAVWVLYRKPAVHDTFSNWKTIPSVDMWGFTIKMILILP